MMNQFDPVADTRWYQEAEGFAEQIDRASHILFQGADLHLKLGDVSQRLRSDCRRIASRQQRGSEAIPIVLVGTLGQGKSWLARCFLKDPSGSGVVRDELRSGQNEADRTRKITWLGPQRPVDLADDGEQFVSIASENLIDLGRPYLIGDTPGCNDAESVRRRLSAVGVRSAPIKILVTSLGELRSGMVQQLIEGLSGSLVLPVIRFEPSGAGKTEVDAAIQSEVDGTLARWKASSVGVELLPPLFMPIERIFGSTQAVQWMQQQLRTAIGPLLDRSELLQQAAVKQVHYRTLGAKREVAELLGEFRARLGRHVQRLEEMTHELPERLLEELLGDDMALRAAVRQRFRADWIERTPLLCFPYRSFLGLLALTAGAWDRLMFSLTGSLPSLAGTLFQTVKNLRESADAVRRLREGVAQRFERLIQQEFRAAVANFQQAVASSRSETAVPQFGSAASEAPSIRLVGLENVEVQSQSILQRTIERHRAWRGTVWLMALLGTGSFVYLIAGPVVALYGEYLSVHYTAMAAGQRSYDAFPAPALGTLMAWLLISVAPAMLIALLAMSWACHGRRVRRTVSSVQTGHQVEVQQRFADGGLKIELTDPRFEASRLLLGLSDPSSAPPVRHESA